ncbi:hypothetical protein [Bdellovibrio sp. HCB288]|uniref:hypothetical protein n=1 Tax=Bdellovibrio sp. HCB288 TaxID=3394355 RepID=UPI0039B4FE0B
MSLFRILALSPLIFSSMALGKVTEAQCSTKDFSGRFVPPKDQGNAGFCYSFAASDLVAEAAGVKPPDTVSALYAGSQYISMSPDEVKKANEAISFDTPKQASQPQMGSMGGGFGGGGFATSVSLSDPNYRIHDPKGKPLLKREGGQTDLIAAHLINQGRACLEKEIPSEILGKNPSDPEQQGFFSMQLGSRAGGDEMNKVRENKKLYYDLQNTCMREPPLKGLDQLRPYKEAVQDWAADHLRKNVTEACKSPVKLKGLEVHSRSFTAKEQNPESAAYIMSVLDQDRPFALHYNVTLMRKWPEGAPSWHSSIVTGRRWNITKGTCEIEIKNSWGDSCAEALEPGICDKGRWYLDIEKLANDRSEVIWIQK